MTFFGVIQNCSSLQLVIWHFFLQSTVVCRRPQGGTGAFRIHTARQQNSASGVFLRQSSLRFQFGSSAKCSLFKKCWNSQFVTFHIGHQPCTNGLIFKWALIWTSLLSNESVTLFYLIHFPLCAHPSSFVAFFYVHSFFSYYLIPLSNPYLRFLKAHSADFGPSGRLHLHVLRRDRSGSSS